MQMNNSPKARKVKIIAATYLKNEVAEIDSVHTVEKSVASELVSHGRAIYTEAMHADVEPPPSAVIPEAEPAPAEAPKPTTLSLTGK